MPDWGGFFVRTALIGLELLTPVKEGNEIIPLLDR